MATEDRRQHITLIQAAVGRMASASSSAKGWLLPVATAAYGYSLSKDKPGIAILGVLVAVIFGVLDVQYLRQERAFRALYRAAVAGTVDDYDMNNRKYYGKPNGDEEDLREENCRMGKVFFSWSVFGFYGPILALGVAIAISAAHWPSTICIRLG